MLFQKRYDFVLAKNEKKNFYIENYKWNAEISLCIASYHLMHWMLNFIEAKYYY